MNSAAQLMPRVWGLKVRMTLRSILSGLRNSRRSEVYFSDVKTMKRLIFPILVITFLLSTASAEAGKKAEAPQLPSAAEQQAFTERYRDAVEGGEKAYEDFVKDLGKTGPQADMEYKMFGHLVNGRAAD